MPKRPKISVHISREVLIASGHRCAVCGAGCPLERAHIIPWHKSKEHRASDLICLCANCHERADRENWGEDVLRQYKEKPWVLRHFEKHQSRFKLAEIDLTISMKLADFDEHYERWLQYGLAAFLDIAPSLVRITKKEKGSTRVHVLVPKKCVRRLLDAFEHKELELHKYLYPLRVTSMRSKLEARIRTSELLTRAEMVRAMRQQLKLSDSFAKKLVDLLPRGMPKGSEKCFIIIEKDGTLIFTAKREKGGISITDEHKWGPFPSRAEMAHEDFRKPKDAVSE